MKVLTGFSKLNITEKIDLIKKNVTLNDQQVRLLNAFHENDKDPDGVIEKLSENYISYYSLPFRFKDVFDSFEVRG